MSDSRIEDLFHEALELDGAEQCRFLDRACEGDSALRQRLDRLLGVASGPDEILDAPVTDLASRLLDQEPPVRIGGYRVRRVLGVGGHGAVFAAVQEQPQREVAIKTMHSGLLSEAARRRFQAEIELLGRLDHPGICRIFDAGEGAIEFESGREEPTLFFVMELIDGVPVTTYAKQRQLGIEECLSMLAAVADAVHHAHQRGIIHRDLKPGNVLVAPPREPGETGTAERSGLAGRPFVVDFGIARLNEESAGATMMSTLPGTVLGTMGYMSPEQIEGSSDVDVRTDVWALGVLGWELISGQRPFAVDQVSIVEAARILRDQEPPKLVSAVGSGVTRDVETILRQALAKDPDHRYGSAAEFAADLRRFLSSEPITARPPSLGYHAAMFARRHRGLVAGVATAALALVVGAAVSVMFAFDALSARDDAVEAREVAEEISRFLREDLLEQADPSASLGREVTVRELLDRAEGRIDGRFPGRPLVEAEIRSTIARVYAGIGDVDRALVQARLAYKLLASAEAVPIDIRLDVLDALGDALHENGDPPETEQIRLEAYELARSSLDGDDPRIFQTGVSYGDQLAMQARPGEAVEFLRKLLPEAGAALGADHEAVLTARNNLGLALDNIGDHEGAIAQYRIVVEARERLLSADHPDTMTTTANLALALWRNNELEESLRLGEAVLARRRRVLGDEHRATLLSWNNLALVHARNRDSAEAARIATEALEVSDRVLGVGHKDTIRLRGNLSSYLLELQRPEEALAEAKKALAAARETYPESHFARGWHQVQVAKALAAMRRPEEVLPEVEQAYGILRAARGANHWMTRDAARLGLATVEFLRRESLIPTWRERVDAAESSGR